ncbi:hypothetical protein ANO11243_074220 [Dothideomycetidae sp. 11243]|nr:hypothetical protein ANO11243_074220 [fungal sp. No.11243]
MPHASLLGSTLQGGYASPRYLRIVHPSRPVFPNCIPCQTRLISQLIVRGCGTLGVDHEGQPPDLPCARLGAAEVAPFVILDWSMAAAPFDKYRSFPLNPAGGTNDKLSLPIGSPHFATAAVEWKHQNGR